MQPMMLSGPDRTMISYMAATHDPPQTIHLPEKHTQLGPARAKDTQTDASPRKYFGPTAHPHIASPSILPVF